MAVKLCYQGDPSLMHLACLATLMSYHTTKQSVYSIYIYIYIYDILP